MHSADDLSYFFKCIAVEVNVNIVRYGHIGVSEQFWQNFNIATSVIAVRGEGMSKHMIALVGDIGPLTSGLQTKS